MLPSRFETFFGSAPGRAILPSRPPRCSDFFAPRPSCSARLPTRLRRRTATDQDDHRHVLSGLTVLPGGLILTIGAWAFEPGAKAAAWFDWSAAWGGWLFLVFLALFWPSRPLCG